MVHIQIGAEKIFSVFGLSLTNTYLMSLVVVLFLICTALLIHRNIRLVPGNVQNIAEIGTEKMLTLMEGIMHSKDKAEKYFPIIATIFISILISNWFGIIPGVGSIGFYETGAHGTLFVPILRSAASDLNFTLAVAVIAVLSVNLMGILSIGVWKYASRYISFKSPISFFVGLLELLGEISKMISFSFRLFGNIFAGEVLLIIIGALAPFIIPIPFLGLELFVGFIQALVFSMLTIVFLSIATAENH